MDKQELIIKLNIVKDYIEFFTDSERVAEICDNNPHQQIGWYRGALKSVKADLEVIKQWIDEH